MLHRTLVAACLLLVACGGSAPHATPAPAPAPPAASYVDTFTATGPSGPRTMQVPRVTVLDAGTGTARVLRYTPTKGVLEVLFRTHVRGESAEGPLDISSEVAVTLDVAPVTPFDPRIMRLAATVRSARQTHGGKAKLGIEGYTTLVGRTVTIIATTQGQLVGARAGDELPESEILNALGQSIGLAMLPPVPATGVASGARWSIRQPAPISGFSGIEDAAYELTSNDRVMITGAFRRTPMSGDVIEEGGVSDEAFARIWLQVDKTRGKTFEELSAGNSPYEHGVHTVDADAIGGPGHYVWKSTVEAKGRIDHGEAGASSGDAQAPMSFESTIDVTVRAP